ncbi:MAG: amidohydrolase family protein [Gammaproteobacteria bacterium]|jgi:predicted TIM-barrel fold metal-dependent hydrolase|nr:amidohydrolase family protein [Gammaproteobacteria bacterium]MDC0465088.1 amidohydrolase [Pseudomonadales bacterium]
MAYIEGRTVHDADSHVMELPDKILEYLAPSVIDAFIKNANKPVTVSQDLQKAIALQSDPSFRAEDDAQLMLRKNHLALGAFESKDRPKTLDLLGFTSQLVFTTTALGNFGLDEKNPILAQAAAQAHNRMNSDFCSVDPRLLATGYVPLSDISAAPRIATEAIELGCRGLVIPSACPAHHSTSHIGLDPLWALLEEAGLPVLFHVGGEKKMSAAYANNGGERVLDFHGGDENFTGLSFMSIPLSIWQTMTALIFDGVLERFPRLKFGAIELGASWVPSWMAYMDAGFEAFRRGEARLQKLSMRPSDYAKRQFRVTPYSHEPTGWILANSDPGMLLFSSDFPHVEGGRNPVKRFEDQLKAVNDLNRRRFYRDNFIDLMGTGLDSALQDHPSLTPH